MDCYFFVFIFFFLKISWTIAPSNFRKLRTYIHLYIVRWCIGFSFKFHIIITTEPQFFTELFSLQFYFWHIVAQINKYGPDKINPGFFNQTDKTLLKNATIVFEKIYWRNFLPTSFLPFHYDANIVLCTFFNVWCVELFT